jgi:putative transcriptional regulator
MPATSLAGQLLVAMPTMSDKRFERSVIYVCDHNDQGAMGLVINKLFESLTLSELLQHLGIDSDGLAGRRVHFGGPVGMTQGFVLHSTDYVEKEHTHLLGGELAVTATLDILRAIGRGEGPQHSLIALGYAGWSPGQLDAEIQANGWLNVAADPEIVFGSALDDKWQKALAKMGVDLVALSGEAGHA